MAKITKDNVLHTAELAVIAISEEEEEKNSKNLRNVIDTTKIKKKRKHISKLNANNKKIQNNNTDGVKPTIYGNNNDNVLRKDEPKRTITQEEALKNAPAEKDGQFEVPSIME